MRLHSAALTIAAIATIAGVGISGCDPTAPKFTPPIPILDVFGATSSFEKNIYRALEIESFEIALIRRPSKRGADILVPVGGYFSTRLINALPDDPRVSLIRLDRFRSVCGGPTLFLTTGLRCSVDIAMTVVVGLSEHRIAFDGEKDVGPVLVPGDRSRPFARDRVGLRMVHAQARIVARYAADRAAAIIRAVLAE